MINESIFSVSSLNKYIKQMFDSNFLLKGIRIKGEISNYKKYPSGHIYFTLKDSESCVKGVMFFEYAKNIACSLKDGDEVIVTGNINVYQTRGEYQIYAQTIDLYGTGELLLKLEELKRKLSAEGLFDVLRKRKINQFPKRIGIVSAPNSAALVDIKTNLLRRNPLIEIIEFTSLVQGDNAPKELIKALNEAKNSDLDTLIIGRGGGSSEDLNAFNDEALVREVANFPVPTISAVGHEIDFTLVDYAADARVSTPTGAAELATIDKREIYDSLNNNEILLDEKINQIIRDLKNNVALLKANSFFTNPKVMYSETLKEVKNYKEILLNNMHHIIELNYQKISSLSKELNSISVKSTLNRGYSISKTNDGKIIKSINDIKTNDLIKTEINDGYICAQVINKESK